MSRKIIDRLIVNSPYEEPKKHWLYIREEREFALRDGRREAGYIKALKNFRSFDDPGEFVEIPLVNQIRPRVKKWREAGYPGVTGVTRKLLEHWNGDDGLRHNRLFFCQLEAIETLIWLAEAADNERVGIDIPSDGGKFIRQCAKMATGTGKTVVMAMVIAWQVLNKVASSQDTRFSKNILIIAPGLTVKNRLAVLQPSSDNNYYDEFNIVPPGLHDKLLQGRVLVRNWHVLNWESEEQIAKKRSIDKRGAKSDKVYVREVLGEMAQYKNILVINDEAHHAWRAPEGASRKRRRGDDDFDFEEATKWIAGLDRIHRARGILRCYDFTATPFVPSGGQSMEDSLFKWIVSDFGLNDAIESGLVKTPRVVVRDDAGPDAKTFKSKFYHLYDNEKVKDDFQREVPPNTSLPALVNNAYYFLGYDWRETMKLWKESGALTPPVMITVANRTHTAARIKYAFDHKKIRIDELYAPDNTLHIDSKVLKQAEESEEPIADTSPEDDDEKQTQKARAEALRNKVNTVGQKGKSGEQIQNVISVGMLSEGWDARTVTHIMGLRAFSSQLLCEQVVGRGLRRRSYDFDESKGLFEPEYVNVFGVPFTFLPHESPPDDTPKPDRPTTVIKPVREKQEFFIRWPNVTRIEYGYRPKLSLNWDEIRAIPLDAAETARIAELAPTIAGKPDFSQISDIDLEPLAKEFRAQKIIFEATHEIYEQMKPAWKGRREYLLAQVVGIVERFIASEDKIRILPERQRLGDLQKRLIITLNMTTIVREIFSHIHFENLETTELVLDQHKPRRSTADMRPWETVRPCEHARKSHINQCVYDGTWEASEAFHLDRDENVAAWAKNDHLNFGIFYVYRGIVRRYYPDFLIRLADGTMLVLEVKGKKSDEAEAKLNALKKWTAAVTADGRFGAWTHGISYSPGDIKDTLLNLSK